MNKSVPGRDANKALCFVERRGQPTRFKKAVHSCDDIYYILAEGRGPAVLPNARVVIATIPVCSTPVS